MSKIEIIISHSHADLDSLASMLLASKIYPNAKMVFTGDLNENVKEVVSLYGNYLNIYKSKDIDEKKVEKIIMVDTANEKRLGKFRSIINNSLLKVIVYDHHQTVYNNKKNWNYNLTKYGATTTYLLEKVLESGIKLSDYEATIVMMGIYEDTGSLTYSNTTVKDIESAAYLLGVGANLRLVSQFISKTMKKNQIDFFIELLQNGEVFEFVSNKVFIVSYYSDEYIGDLDIICNKIKDIEGVKGVFLIVGNNEHSYIVARSSSIDIRVNEILKRFNGAGHYNAAAASLKDIEFESIFENLKDEIYIKTTIGKRAKDIMTSPVKIISKETKIKDVYKIMIRFSYNGIPVIEKNKVIGLIRRRDVDKALKHGFSNAKVSVYMNKNIIFAGENTTIDELKKLILENDTGRIIIIDSNNSLRGIVSRSDILRSIYEHKKDITSKEYIFQDNLKEKLLSKFSEDIINIFNEIKKLSRKRDEKVYLVGGLVRDLIMDIENLDIDIVVEGNGIEFSRELFEILDAEKIVEHEKFKTATLDLGNDLKLDIASSRIEYYEYPSSLPTVEYGSLKQDLFRRDFTINAMALEIDDFHFGRLIDFFQGYEDIKNKRLRVLHSLSFIEDPTRIIRGIRFANRLDFEIEENSKKQINEAIENGFLNKLSWKRVKTEFMIIFKEKKANTAVEKLFQYGVVQAIHKNITYNKKLIHDMKNIKKYEKYINELKIEIWLIYFLTLLEELNSKDLEFVFRKFAFGEKFIEKFSYGKIKRDIILESIAKSEKNSDLYSSFEYLTKEMIIILLISSNYIIQEKIVYYLDNLMNIKSIIRGQDLIDINYIPKKNYSKCLKKIFEIQIDKDIKNKEELLEYIDN